MPTCLPEQPEFSTQSERLVWERLRDGLGPDDLLIASQRVTDHLKDHELDLVVVLAGGGLVVVEVKGSQVSCTDGRWCIRRDGRDRVIDPVRRVRQGKYALRSYVERDPRWVRSRIRWCHELVLR